MKPLIRNQFLPHPFNKKSFYRLISLTIIFTFMYQAVSLIPIDLKNIFSNKTGTVLAEQTAKVELIDERTEKSKTYLNPDGTFTKEVYQSPVNIENSKGDLVPIDSSLKENTDGDLINKQAPFNVNFSNGESPDIYSISYDNFSVGFELLGQNVNINRSQTNANTAYYKDVLTDTSLEYVSGNNNVKESIVLSSAPSNPNYSFKLNLSNLKPKEVAGIIILTDDKDNPVFTLVKPFMEDSIGAHSEDVTFALDETSDGYILNVKADPNWLSDPARVYPVKIDPTVYVKTDGQGIDTYLREQYPNSIYGSSTIMHNGSQGAGKRMRSYMYFDTSAIPRNAIVSSATLNLYKYINQLYPDSTTELYRVTRQWDSYATWNKYDQVNNWTTPGGDYDPNPIYSEVEVPSETVKNYDITNQVKNWVEGAQANYGLMYSNSSFDKIAGYYTSQSSSQSLWPKLTITYKNAIGLEDYSSYKDVGPVKVNLQNGNLVYLNNDINISGRGVATSISHVYNSLAETDTTYGYNWGITPNVKLTEDTNQNVTITEGDGSEHIYTWNGSGYNHPPGIYKSLVKNQDGTYSLTDIKSHITQNFNSSGFLVSEVDSNNNTTSYTWTSGKLTRITDASGRQTNLTYDGPGGKLSSVEGPRETLKINGTPSGSYVSYDNGAFGNPIGEERVEIGMVIFNKTKGDTAAIASIDISANQLTVTDPSDISTWQDDDDLQIGNVSPPIHDTSFTYSGNRLMSIGNSENEYVTFSYNGDQLTGITNPMWASTIISYNSHNQVSSIIVPTEPQGTTSFTYKTIYNQNRGVNDINSETNVTDPLGDIKKYNLNTTGQTLKITDPIGATPDPETPEADFSNDEMIESEANADYDAFYNTLTQHEKDVNAKMPAIDRNYSTTTYDENYNILSETTKTGVTTSYTYDANGNQLTSADGAGQVSTSTYENNNIKTETTPEGKTTTYNYDSNNNLISEVDSEGNTKTYGYDSYGNKIWDISANGNVSGTPDDYKTSYSYNIYGYNIQTISPITNTINGNERIITSSVFDVLGNRNSETDGTGNIITYTYDNVGRQLTSQTAKLVNGQNHTIKTLNSYNDNGNQTLTEVIDVIDNNSVKSKKESIYNNSNQLTSNKTYSDVNDPSSASTISYTYDAAGNKLTETNPLGGIINYEYDALKRLLKQTNPDGTFTAYKYDAEGNRIKVGDGEQTTVNIKSITGSEVANADAPTASSSEVSTTKNINNGDGQQIKVADDYNYKKTFNYNVNGDILFVIEPNNQTTTYGYDSNGNQTSTIYANSTLTSTTYNPSDQERVISDQKQIPESDIINTYDTNEAIKKVDQPYDADKQATYSTGNTLTEVTATGTNTLNSTNSYFTVDAMDNNLSTQTKDPNNNNATVTSESFIYDDLSQLTQLQDLLGITMYFSYDKSSNLKTVKDSITQDAGKISYGYDTSSKLTTVDLATNNIANISYDNFGNRNYEVLNNGITTDLIFNDIKQVTNYFNRLGSNTLSSYSNTFDSRGNIVGVTEPDGTTSYQYDELSRLTSVINKDASQVTYQYDSVGNRTSKVNTQNNTTTLYTYNEANELYGFRIKDNSTGQTIYIGSFSHDFNGNMTTYSSDDYNALFIYDNNNNLVRVNIMDTNVVVEFTYNAKGQRYSKKVTSGSNTTYTYYQYDSEGNIVLETDENQNIRVKYIRDNAGKAFAMQQNNNLYYYLYNAHGDVTGVTDSGGNVITTYTYDEFGNLVSPTGTIYNPLRYSAANNAYYDIETGFYKMGARYYMPDFGRWLTRDSFNGKQRNPQTQNKYIYTENNPINSADPSGHRLVKVLAAGSDKWAKISDWKTKLKDRIETADDAFYDLGVNFNVEKYTSWNSSYDNDTNGNVDRAYNEMISATGWNNNKQGMNVLLGIIRISSSVLDDNISGARGATKSDAGFIVNQNSFTNDWKLFRHEMGHLSPWNLSDHQSSNDCIMYKLPLSASRTNFHTGCANTIAKYK